MRTLNVVSGVGVFRVHRVFSLYTATADLREVDLAIS